MHHRYVQDTDLAGELHPKDYSGEDYPIDTCRPDGDIEHSGEFAVSLTKASY